MKKILLLMLVPWVTWAQPNQGGGPFPNGTQSAIAKLNGFGTNTTFYGSNTANMSLVVTNSAANTSPSFQNFVLNFLTLTNGVTFNFGDVDGTYGSWKVTPGHGGAPITQLGTEHQFISSGSQAYSVGYGQNGIGHFQWGAGSVASTWGYWQNNSNLTANSTFGYSGALTFRCVYLNGSGTSKSKYPGLFGQPRDAVGNYELTFVGDLNSTGAGNVGDNNDVWSVPTATPVALRLGFNQTAFTGLQVLSNLNVSGVITATNDVQALKKLIVGDLGTPEITIDTAFHSVVFNPGNSSINTGLDMHDNVPSHYFVIDPGALGYGGNFLGGTFAINKKEVVTNSTFEVNGRIEAQAGYRSLTNVAATSTSVSFPATTVNWTNTFGLNIVMYIDNSGVTGTAIKKNGQQIFSSLVGDVTLLFKPGDYFSATYTIGTPVARWEPF